MTKEHKPSWHVCHCVSRKNTHLKTEQAVTKPFRMTLSYNPQVLISEIPDAEHSFHNMDNYKMA